MQLVAVSFFSIFVTGVVIALNRESGSGDLVLVAVEQIFLAGGLAALLYSQQGRSQDTPGLPLLSKWVPFACYAVLITIVISFATRRAIGVDESALLFQAKTFLSGSLSVPAPPGSEALYRTDFQFPQHVIYKGRWFSEYQPGWPAVLALAIEFQAEKFLNPVLALAYLILVFKLAHQAFGKDTAVLSALTLAMAPAFLYLASGFLTHVPCGFLILLAFYWAWQARDANRPAFLLAGVVVCLACAAMIRQYTAFLAATVIGPLAISSAWRSRKRLTVLALSAFTCGALLASWNLYYDRALMGDPMRVPYSYNFPHPFIWSWGHLLSRLVYTRWSIQGTMMYGFVLMFPLIVVCLFYERRQRLLLWSLAALFAALVLGHMPFSLDSGQYFWRPGSWPVSFTVGERFYSEAYFALAILTGRGLVLVLEYFRVSRLVALTCMVVLALVQCLHIGIYLEKTRRRNEFNVTLQQFVLAERSSGAVVFGPDYFGNINFNDPDWQHEPKFYMHDPGESNREALVRILGRRSWVVVQYDEQHQAVVARRYGLSSQAAQFVRQSRPEDQSPIRTKSLQRP